MLSSNDLALLFGNFRTYQSATIFPRIKIVILEIQIIIFFLKFAPVLSNKWRIIHIYCQYLYINELYCHEPSNMK